MFLFPMLLFMTPSHFFDLSDSPFIDLFDEELPVWAALKRLSSWLKGQKLGVIEGSVSSGAYLVNPELISIGKGSVVEPGAYLKGPLWLGENCVVRHGAYLRGEVVAASGVVLGHDTEVKHSIFLKGAHAAHFAYVGDSIVGAHVNLGAGVKLANLRLDDKEVVAGMRKLGAVIGDGSQIGCNAVLNPGTFVGKEVDIYPLVNAGGTIPSHSRVSTKLSVEVRAKSC